MTLEQDLQSAMDADDPGLIADVEHRIDLTDHHTRARLREPRALKDAALYYATTLGWEVFPCKAGEKVPATRHGLHDATLDKDQIWEWWTRNPQFNIGLPTGTYFDVVDIDGHQGMQSLLEWCREEDTTTAELFNPRLGSVLTPRRPGTHIYTAPTGEGNRAGVRPGIDWRGQSGYVLAPPSKTEHGMYVWAQPIQAGAA